jgi:hypothetical protein
MPVVIDRKAVTIAVEVCGEGQVALRLRLGNSTLGAVLTAAESKRVAEALVTESDRSERSN